MTHAELVARLPGEDRYLTAILFRPAGAEEFDWLPAGQTVRAGDDVLLYAIDRTDVEQLFALNKEFDRHFYPRQTELNPDESEIIRTRLPPRGERVLEVCCGAGRITRHLPRTGNLVVGLDFNLPNLEVAQRRDGGRVRYVLGDATRLPFADASFSVACCLENSLGVLFSLVDTALAELFRVTRPGGRVLLGLRRQPGRPDNLHLYATRNGLLNVARTFDAESVGALLEALPEAQRSRIASRVELPGAPRSWGGRTFYVELTLA